jgi:lysyl-tRNA synthetase class 2
MRYPNDFAPTHLAVQLARQYRDTPADELERLHPVVAVAGRLMRKSAASNSSLGLLQDHSGCIDILVSEEATGKANHAAYALWRPGDIIGVTGIVCRLAGGALAVRAHDIERLVGAMRPLPEASAGARYLDLLTDPRTRSVFGIRSRFIAGIRAYLAGTAYLEVETPMLQPDAERAAVQFKTQHNALRRELYLRSSGELYLKRLLVGGMEKVFEINRSFANQAPAPDYCPEGTILEMYCAYSSYLYMMALLEPLLARAVHHALGTTSVSWQGHALELGKRFHRTTQAQLRDPQSQLIEPTYVVDFPAGSAQRARRKDDAPELAEQFELFVGGQKVAEGRSELNDADQVAEHHDADFARAVEYGLPPASGLTLSIDRLVMVLTDSPSIREVILFPADAHR